MHMYSTGSNANAAARKMIGAYPGRLTLAAPQRAPGVTPMFYASVAKVKDAVFNDVEVDAIKSKMNLLEPDMAEDTDAQQAELKATKKAPKAKQAKARKAKAKKGAKVTTATAPKTKRVTITEQALTMMRRPNGATSQQLQDAFEWQPHSVRGFVSNENRLRNRGIVTVKDPGKPSRYTLAE